MTEHGAVDALREELVRALTALEGPQLHELGGIAHVHGYKGYNQPLADTERMRATLQRVDTARATWAAQD